MMKYTELYNQLKELDLSESTKNELKEKLGIHEQKRWEDFGNNKGYIRDFYPYHCRYGGIKGEKKLNFTNSIYNPLSPTKEHELAIEASRALAQWYKKVVGDWKPKILEQFYFIDFSSQDEVIVRMECTENKTKHFLPFPTSEQTDQFIKDHYDLLMQFKPLVL